MQHSNTPRDEDAAAAEVEAVEAHAEDRAEPTAEDEDGAAGVSDVAGAGSTAKADADAAGAEGVDDASVGGRG